MSARRVKCPVCGENFRLEDGLTKGDTTYCPGCCVDLRVVADKPYRVEELIMNYGSYEGDEKESEY